jgi:hypothetical protein
VVPRKVNLRRGCGKKRSEFFPRLPFKAAVNADGVVELRRGDFPLVPQLSGIRLRFSLLSGVLQFGVFFLKRG